MGVELEGENLKIAEALVASGRFESVSEAVHAGLEAIHEEEEWKDYARDRIEAGLADIEAGRTISGEDFLIWLEGQRQKRA
jgi:putative addiction module CopG family antidote